MCAIQPKYMNGAKNLDLFDPHVAKFEIFQKKSHEGYVLEVPANIFRTAKFLRRDPSQELS